MIDPAIIGPAIDGALPFHQVDAVQGFIPRPAENHHLFGAGFLLIAVLLVVETLTGSVWHRSRLRTMIFPGTIIGLGLGMLIVTGLETSERPIHFTIGLIMIAAGWMEARHRLGEVPRRTADLWIVPALALGGLEIGIFHFHGSWNNSGAVHVLLGITTGLMALARVGQSLNPLSMPRHALTGVIAAALGFELLALSH